MSGKSEGAGEPAPAQSAASAHAAVNAALDAATEAGSGAGVVSLKLQVGGADLSIRVELKNGEVQTTFRTDSADLRSALASEWQASAPGSATPGLVLSAPVITGAFHSGLAAGDGGSERRGAGQSAPSESFHSSGTSAGAGGAPDSPESDASRSPSYAPNSVHLLTFA